MLCGSSVARYPVQWNEINAMMALKAPMLAEVRLADEEEGQFGFVMCNRWNGPCIAHVPSRSC